MLPPGVEVGLKGTPGGGAAVAGPAEPKASSAAEEVARRRVVDGVGAWRYRGWRYRGWRYRASYINRQCTDARIPMGEC